MPSPNDAVRRQQAELANADAALARQLARRYGTSWQRIRAKLDQLAREIQAARARGETIDEAWLRRRAVVQQLQATAQSEIRVFLEFARRRVDAEILSRAAAGTADATELLRSMLPAGTPPVVPLPVAETAAIIAATRPGAPLAALFEPFGPERATSAIETLIRGLAEGLGPRETARALAQDLGGNLVRALRIARTETLGAYRRATLERYRENADRLDGWVWLAKLDSRTCPVCVAMHGTKHSLDEPFATHPNCRCAAAPIVAGSPIRVETGEEWFARQDVETQRRILGPGKHELYAAGELRLADLVVDTVHPVWGPGRRERALRQLPLSASSPPPPPDAPEAAAAPPAFTLPQPAPGFAEQVGQAWRERHGWAARENDMPIEEYEQAVSARLREETIGKEIRIRVATENVDDVLRDGRFKSQFETQQSGGLLDTNYRAQAERRFFSYDPDMPADQRPIYAYLEGSPESPTSSSLGQYGSIVFRLKPAARARATVTFTDSLGAAMSRDFLPTPLDAPSAHSVHPTMSDPLHAPIRDLGVYTEVQVHGGVTIADVEEIVFPGWQEHLIPDWIRDAARISGVPLRATPSWNEIRPVGLGG